MQFRFLYLWDGFKKFHHSGGAETTSSLKHVVNNEQQNCVLNKNFWNFDASKLFSFFVEKEFSNVRISFFFNSDSHTSSINALNVSLNNLLSFSVQLSGTSMMSQNFLKQNKARFLNFVTIFNVLFIFNDGITH